MVCRLWQMHRAAVSRPSTSGRFWRRWTSLLWAGYGRWDGALLAKHLGDISKHQIWRVLRLSVIPKM
jgi:hypothetical protein